MKCERLGLSKLTLQKLRVYPPQGVEQGVEQGVLQGVAHKVEHLISPIS